MSEITPQNNDLARIALDLPAMRIGPVRKVWGTVMALFRLVMDPAAGWGIKAVAIAALVYLISPLDLAPDFLPFGLIDDVAVILGAAAKLAVDLKRYLAAV